MQVYTEVIGNLLNDQVWKERASEGLIEYINLDQWTAQKSRFVAKSDKGKEYAISLKRHSHINNGDIIQFEAENKHIVAINIDLSPVLVIDLSQLTQLKNDNIINICIELGHALGNQHWPAIVKGNKVYVPLTVDKKVMTSVMDTHNIDHISYEFQPGKEIIPYLTPSEIRTLFGGIQQNNTPHHHNE